MTVAKNAFVGGALNVTVRMLLKGVAKLRKKYLKDNKHNSLHLNSKILSAQIFVLGHILFLKAHSFSRATLSESVRFSEQIMSADKYQSVFSRRMEAIVLNILQVFSATRAVLKIEIEYHSNIPQF